MFREAGLFPYPVSVSRDFTIQEIKEKFLDLEENNQ